MKSIQNGLKLNLQNTSQIQVKIFFLQSNTPMNKDFVSKLKDMLHENYDCAKWNQQGTEFRIDDLDTFKNKLLPQYFRHERFDSFVRQLNMYGFHKASRRKSELVFRHDYFIRDKEDQYYLIKRKGKNERNMVMNKTANMKIRRELHKLREAEPNFEELFKQLCEFKQTAHENNLQIKSKIDHLIKEVSWKKNKLIKPVVADIKDSLSEMDHAYKVIQQIIDKKFDHQSPNLQSQSEELEMVSEKREEEGEERKEGKLWESNDNGPEVCSLCSLKSMSHFFI